MNSHITFLYLTLIKILLENYAEFATNYMETKVYVSQKQLFLALATRIYERSNYEAKINYEVP